jgi:hypothetical protein
MMRLEFVYVQSVGLMQMEPVLRKHVLALLELGIIFDQNAGLTESRLRELEHRLSLSHEVMREAIMYLGERGLVNPLFVDPQLPYGVSQAFVTDAGKMVYHELLEESEQVAEKSDLRDLFAQLVSVRIVAWIFASLVFGGYVISLEAALLQSTGFYGGVAFYLVLAYLANMVMPIQMSIIAWIIASGLLFLGQFFAKPKQWGVVIFGGFNMLLSLWTYGTVGISLSVVHVPWFISFLDLSPPTTLLVIGGVCAIALLYVVASPFVWHPREKPQASEDRETSSTESKRSE